MGRKSSKAREIEGLIQGGKSASQVIKERPDLAEGFDELVTVKAPRQRRARSGATDRMPRHTEAPPMGLPQI